MLQDWAVPKPNSRERGSGSEEMAALNNDDQRQRVGEDVRPDEAEP